jgi:biotin carboxyl carrier protein
MKYKAQIANSEQTISLELADGSGIAEVDGRRYEIEHRKLRGGEYLLINATDVYKCRVAETKGSKNSFSVVLGRASYDITLVDPKRLSSARSSAGHDHGSAEIISPMPGKIVRVLVEVGANVEAGAGIIVVEAMKMQNEMKAPKAGVVVSINAKAGATVNAGDVLAVID